MSARLEQLLTDATPGPWVAQAESGDEWWFGAGQQSRIRGVAQRDYEMVAVLPGDDEAQLAEAALIALAPDMARLLLDMGEALTFQRQAYGHLWSIDEVVDNGELLARLDALGKNTA